MALLDETGDLMNREMMRDPFISPTLMKWSREDPLAALEWLRGYGETHSEDDTRRLFLAVVSGVATEDPRLALAMVTEFGFEVGPSLISRIGSAALTPERRSELLAALREQVAEIEDSSRGAALWKATWAAMSAPLFRQGFEPASAWLESSALSPEELAPIIESMQHHDVGSDFGKWFDWFADQSSEEGQRQSLGNSFAHWTRNDHRAAAAWLDQAPPGPLRDTALERYVQAAARPRPDLAAARVDEMPPGETRADLIREIHRAWQSDDPAAAADFAARHGLEPE